MQKSFCIWIDSKTFKFDLQISKECNKIRNVPFWRVIARDHYQKHRNCWVIDASQKKSSDNFWKKKELYTDLFRLLYYNHNILIVVHQMGNIDLSLRLQTFNTSVLILDLKKKYNLECSIEWGKCWNNW